MSRTGRLVPVEGAALRALVHELGQVQGGAWSFGIEGAVAEFPVGGDRQGDIRFTLPEYAVAFVGTRRVILAVPRAGLDEPTAELTVLGPDIDALRSAHREDVLIDLGVGSPVVRFCIRTGDPALLGQLRGLAGAPLSETLPRAGAAILEHSPHRVVITPLGRCEVFSQIPPPGGRSPDGPHTHLLPDALARGGELYAGAIPADFAGPVVFHPPPGWTPPAEIFG